jgi:hypothetical protein
MFSTVQTAWRRERDSNPQYNSETLKGNVCAGYIQSTFTREFDGGPVMSKFANQSGLSRIERRTRGDSEAESCQFECLYVLPELAGDCSHS